MSSGDLEQRSCGLIEVLFRNLSGGNEKNPDKSRQPVSQPKFESSTSRIHGAPVLNLFQEKNKMIQILRQFSPVKILKAYFYNMYLNIILTPAVFLTVVLQVVRSLKFSTSSNLAIPATRPPQCNTLF
jgi:hypothetical protein